MDSKKITNVIPYLLIGPVLLIMLALYVYPIGLVFLESISKTSILTGQMDFVGLYNFKAVLGNKIFKDTLLLTLKYTIITVIIKILLGFFMAVFLNSDMYFTKTLRFLSLLPWAIQQVSVATVWKWILDGNYGYLNYYLTRLGIIKHNIVWLSDPKIAFMCAAIVDAWLGISLVSMIFLSGLTSIDRSLYESAKIDGANIFHRFKFITFNEMKRLIIVTSLLVTIWTFNSFNVIFVLTGGGPMRSTETLIVRIYQEAFYRFDQGASSALSVIVFLFLLMTTLVYIKLISKVDREV